LNTFIPTDYFVIFGAAVRGNGEPSGAMNRRVYAAFTEGKNKANSIYIPTGGVGKTPFSEAETMKMILINLGINEDKILLDEKSKDTFASTVNCTQILKSRMDRNCVYVCSDTYHIPRCRWLFYLFGMRTIAVRTESGLQSNGIIKWTYFYFREFVALPYDTLVMLAYRLQKLNAKNQ
jgi:vancomycin permeability regulator SanA